MISPPRESPDARGRLGRFLREPLIEQFERLSHRYWLIKTAAFYRRYFATIGRGSKIVQPLRIRHPEHIRIGERVLIHRHAWLQAIIVDGAAPPRIAIGDRCTLGHFVHLTGANVIELEPDVLVADKVLITDHGHEYRDPRIPIQNQGVAVGRPVHIGAGSWIGDSVAILSARIGRHCVIGANSVVTSDIPDFSVAAGVPARVLRTYSPLTAEWCAVAPMGLSVVTTGSA